MSNRCRIRYTKFCVDICNSFGDILEKPGGGRFCPPGAPAVEAPGGWGELPLVEWGGRFPLTVTASNFSKGTSCLQIFSFRGDVFRSISICGVFSFQLPVFRHSPLVDVLLRVELTSNGTLGVAMRNKYALTSQVNLKFDPRSRSGRSPMRLWGMVMLHTKRRALTRRAVWYHLQVFSTIMS